MVTTRAKFLFIILALLQFVTPLVHAHTSGESADQGFHIPGYEHFSVNSDSAEFYAISHPCTAESSIICVGAAIKHKKTLSDHSSTSYLLTEIFSFKSVTQSSFIPPQLSKQIVYSIAEYMLLPSRAPPSQKI